ncbi:MAG: FAD binding domain-containing protein [Planctomyces sp.]|nr:FAD binding domain-containing protein [Planctomyces sp.]
MRNFEYAAADSEADALSLLADHPGETAILAGGTDLVSLLQKELVNPRRVVDISRVSELKAIEPTDDGGVRIGALATLEELLASPLAAEYPSLRDVASAIRAIQIQQYGTIGGDLCHLPNCWYFRKGYGLLGDSNGRALSEEGDNRYHAIFGNRGRAKFVSASRFAPSLIAWDASVRIAGPAAGEEAWLPLEQFFVTPKGDQQGVTRLAPGQLITHLELTPAAGRLSGAYEVLEMSGLDWPLAAAASTLEMEGGVVSRAKIVLGHVAPTPWVSHPAADVLRGQPITEATAELAGEAAVSEASPLKDNEYKVRLAKTAVKRSLLRAAGANV